MQNQVDIACKAVEARYNVLLSQAHEEILEHPLVMECCAELLELLASLKFGPMTIEKCFLADLAVMATRSWEAYAMEGEVFMFPDFASGQQNEPLIASMISDSCYFIEAAKKGIILQKLSDFQIEVKSTLRDGSSAPARVLDNFESLLLEPAKEEIRKNIAIVRQIRDIDLKCLDDFLSAQEVYVFSLQTEDRTFLNGLSSFDGTRAYLSKDWLKVPSKAQATLEHEFMHNLPRWQEPLDPRKISPSKNSNLRHNGRMVEAGDFYNFHARNIEITNPCPFCLSVTPRRLQF